MAKSSENELPGRRAIGTFQAIFSVILLIGFWAGSFPLPKSPVKWRRLKPDAGEFAATLNVSLEALGQDRGFSDRPSELPARHLQSSRKIRDRLKPLAATAPRIVYAIEVGVVLSVPDISVHRLVDVHGRMVPTRRPL